MTFKIPGPLLNPKSVTSKVTHACITSQMIHFDVVRYTEECTKAFLALALATQIANSTLGLGSVRGGVTEYVLSNTLLQQRVQIPNILEHSECVSVLLYRPRVHLDMWKFKTVDMLLRMKQITI